MYSVSKAAASASLARRKENQERDILRSYKRGQKNHNRNGAKLIMVRNKKDWRGKP